jgi:2-succinyl-5-enolpyruvyl-6-hydroxy-3-cyclohexene-1-carboxylate synthase
MYSSKKNVQILVALLKEHGVRQVVISPGSRNMSIVSSVETDPFFTCWSVVDERSAAYFAIGISIAQDCPVMLSCTSGQATRNYIPGMTQAFYSGAPLVVVTADWAPSKIGQGVMQALNQLSLPADATKISVSLPVVKDKDDAKNCARLVNEALLELRHHGSGPVHINVPIEEHWDGGTNSLLQAKIIRRFGHGDSLPDIQGRRIMIAVGEHKPFGPEQETALSDFAERYDAVVYTNHLSNYHGKNVVNAGLLVESIGRFEKKAYHPDLLISIGGQLGDYDFDAMVRRLKCDHWRVNEDGEIRDTYGQLTNVFELREQEFFSLYLGGEKIDTGGTKRFFDLWSSAKTVVKVPKNLPLSQTSVAAIVAPLIPRESVIHFGILSSLRNWSMFDLDASIKCFSNVAAFGIDGSMSTFIGHASAVDDLCFLVIGDLSFFYDMNSIGIRGIKSNARILLINNGGGGEFRQYSHSAQRYFGEAANAHIAAAGHFGSAAEWVQSMGWGYFGAKTEQCLVDSLDWFTGLSDVPLLLEVFTTMEGDSDALRLFRQLNSTESFEKRSGKKLPPKAKALAKKTFGA